MLKRVDEENCDFELVTMINLEDHSILNYALQMDWLLSKASARLSKMKKALEKGARKEVKNE